MKKLLIPIIFIFCLMLSGCHMSLDKVSKDLNTYDIEAEFIEEGKTLYASQTVYYKNRTDVTLNCVDFHLYPNAFREDAKFKPVSFSSEARAYYNGKSYGGIDIESVSVNNKTQEVNVCGEDKNILEVKTDELYPGDEAKIFIAYKVKLPNVRHRFGYGENTYNFGNFYPVACVYEDGGFVQDTYSYNGDPFYSDMANYNIKLKVSNDFILASSGTQQSKKSNDAITTYEINAKVVRDFAFVLSRDFKVLTKKCGNTLVYYYHFDDGNAEKSLKTSCDSIETFNKLFGEYPYSTLSVVESDFVHGGMEYPTLVYISAQVSDYEEYTNVIVHEIAHQWWYGLVGNDEYKNAWQDEALAEVSTLLFYEENDSYGISVSGKKKILNDNYAMFLDVFRSVYGKVDESMTRSLDEYKSETEYTYITYVKGNIMFCDLKDFVGKKKFVKSLKKYFEKCVYKNAIPDDLISCFESVCGKDAGKFIKSYLDGTAIITTK